MYDLILKEARYLDVFDQTFKVADIAIKDGKIAGVGSFSGENERYLGNKTVVPGFIDAHLHLESSIVSPVQYAESVLPHGTMTIVADPHEIANVCGTDGFDYILDSTKDLPIDVYIMISSCVPATHVDEAGAVIDSKTVEKYLENDRVLGLAEVMNYPGVINNDPEVMAKINATKAKGKVIDGHAPGLSGRDLKTYVEAGIRSDHECTTFAEAKEKLDAGMYIMIREGSAAKNLESLMPMLQDPFYKGCMFATDDKNPADLSVDGHIDHIIKQAIFLGAKPEYVYTVASYNAAKYFGLKDKGAIAKGYVADLVVLNNPRVVSINSTYKNGVMTSRHYEISEEIQKNLQECKKKRGKSSLYHTVNIGNVEKSAFKLKNDKAMVVGLIPGELTTSNMGYAQGVDLSRDIIKLAVVERHKATGHVGNCYVNGYGLHSGAVATTISHDSHNIIIAGTNEDDMYIAMKHLEEIQGGVCVVNEGKVVYSVALPIAGLMSEMDSANIDVEMSRARSAAYYQGVNRGVDPFMTLAFAALPVIPHLRLTTLGVFNVDTFQLEE